MTKQEQIDFIKELIHNVSAEIFEKADKFPSNWEGLELRQYVSDTFQHVLFVGTLKGKRKNNYTNDVIVNNL